MTFSNLRCVSATSMTLFSDAEECTVVSVFSGALSILAALKWEWSLRP
jgi:hypothetical protein